MSHESIDNPIAHTNPPPRDDKDKNDGSFMEIARFALIALIIVLPIRWFVAQPFIVSGASMENTFRNNEYLIVDQVTYRFSEPERGDVIIFKYPRDHSKYFIKRVIGLPGETVSIENGRVFIKNDEYPDGFVLDESYALLGKANRGQSVSLGEDEYFVMGDNRDHSSDSRVWGVLRKDEIIGRALLRLLPPSRAEVMPGAVRTGS